MSRGNEWDITKLARWAENQKKHEKKQTMITSSCAWSHLKPFCSMNAMLKRMYATTSIDDLLDFHLDGSQVSICPSKYSYISYVWINLVYCSFQHYTMPHPSVYGQMAMWSTILIIGGGEILFYLDIQNSSKVSYSVALMDVTHGCHTCIWMSHIHRSTYGCHTCILMNLRYMIFLMRGT